MRDSEVNENVLHLAHLMHLTFVNLLRKLQNIRQGVEQEATFICQEVLNCRAEPLISQPEPPHG